MAAAELPIYEAKRLKNLYQLQLLDTENEIYFDDIVRNASSMLHVPISLISLLDFDRQWFKANVGLHATETSREISFCAHVILQDEIFIVENATEDARFSQNPLVLSDPDIRFYAAMPIKSTEGLNLGTLCIMDTKPRTLSEEEIKLLKWLAQITEQHFELRLLRLHEKMEKKNKLEFFKLLQQKVKQPLLHIQHEQMPVMVSQEEEEPSQISENISLILEDLDNLTLKSKYSSASYNLEKDIWPIHLLISEAIESQAKYAASRSIDLINQTNLALTFPIFKMGMKILLQNIVFSLVEHAENGSLYIEALQFEACLQIKFSHSKKSFSNPAAEKMLDVSLENLNDENHVYFSAFHLNSISTDLLQEMKAGIWSDFSEDGGINFGILVSS